MNRFLLSICIFTSTFHGVSAQCTGLQIAGFNADNPDQIRLLVTANLPGNRTYYITDNEWNSSNNDFVDLNENEETWTTPAAGVPSGTIIILNGTSARVGSITGPVIGTLSAVPALATDGEEIYILSVAPSTTNNSVSAANICFAVKSGGSGDLPSGNSVSLGNFDNALYDGTGSITSASNWIVSDAALVLPIVLTDFQAIVEKTAIKLLFATASETNNSHFIIERSADGRVFSEMAMQRGAGTVQEPQSYSYLDESPLPGSNYYRLRQVDFDGRESFSPVVHAVFRKIERISLSPSPATEMLRIQLEEAWGQDAAWELYNAAGRLLLSGNWEAERADYELDVRALPAGIYTFRLAAGTEVQVNRFVRSDF